MQSLLFRVERIECVCGCEVYDRTNEIVLLKLCNVRIQMEIIKYSTLIGHQQKSDARKYSICYSF